MKALLRVCVFLPLLVFSSCKKESGPVEPPTTGTGGTIVTGQAIEVARQTISTSGGTLSINKPGDPLHGFVLTIPSGGFTQAQDIVVSYAEIRSHQLGVNFAPISPLIKISYGGGYSAGMMTVKIPVKLPAGHFAIGFFYDETTGKLEPIPLRNLDSNSVTLSTRHLSPASASLGKTFFGRTQSAIGSLVISSMLATYLDGQPTISTGFAPGVDDWEFPNFGSYVAPGGHCAGQSMTAMWYFYEKKLKGEPPLNHRFDTVNDPANPDSLWPDNPRGYRFATTMQEDQNFDNWIRSLEVQSWVPNLTYYSFIMAMLLTGKPQYVLIRNSVTGAGHAMIVYKISPSTGTLHIADPNYPSNRDPWTGTPTTRTIQYQNGTLKPYSSALVAGGPGVSFDQIGYAAKTSYIEWSKISARWSQFLSGTIGNDRFPRYTLLAGNDAGSELTDTLSTYADTLKVHCRSADVPYGIAGTDHYQEFWVYDSQGRSLDSGNSDNKGVAQLLLAKGDNIFGFYVMGANAQTFQNYVDFRWVNVTRLQSAVDFSKVKAAGISFLSIETRWKDRNGAVTTHILSPAWAMVNVTMNGTTLIGGDSGDSIWVTIGPSSISFKGKRRVILGQMGLANTSITGSISISSQPLINLPYFSFEVKGLAASSCVSSLVLDTDDTNSTLDGYSCLSSTTFALVFRY